MAQGIVQTYTKTTTGVAGTFGAPGGAPFGRYALQVKGTGAAPTAWSVTLDGSLDNTNWTALITHSAVDGSTSFETTGKPALFVRVNVGSLTLAPATDIRITAIAVPS